jgi:sugar-specific transcriptional regulator TrmB
MKLSDALREAGLSERESKVYLALLEIGLTTTGAIVKKSGVPNSKIYEILGSLEAKGLVGYIVKKKTKYFQASDPDKILALFKEKEKEIENVIPELKAKQKLVKERKEVEFFDGLKAIYAMFVDILSDAKKGELYSGFASGEKDERKEIQIFYKKLGVLRYEKGLDVKLLVNKKYKKLYERVYKERIEFLKKILRFGNFDYPGDIAIFKDKIVIINWEEIPTAIVITSNKMAEQYRMFFKQMYDISKPF